MDSFVAIDFETANQHRTSVCSVGIVVVINKVITKEFYALIKPTPNFYSYWNTKVHGLTQEDTINALNFPEVWQQITPFIQGLPFVAHNSAFDKSCLNASLQAYGLSPVENPFFCTYRSAKKALPNLINHKLNTVSSYFGFSSLNHHHALSDAQACAHIALQLL
ncbi:3'-5' exonuclease [Myroides sp. LJL116]